jgi:tetratricopeptide (TPR) repeat protein
MRVIIGLFLVVSFLAGFAQSTRLRKAEAYLGIKEYKHALEYFSICPPRDSVQLNKIAYCQMMLGDSKEAEKNYSRFLQSYTLVDSNTYHYALTLKRNRKYAEAKSVFQKLQKQAPSDKHFAEQLASCDSAAVWERRESVYEIENATKLNSEFSDVTSVPFNGGLVFASNRESVIIRKKSEINEEPYFNLLFSKFDSTHLRFSYPVNFSTVINSPEHEIAPTFSNDNRQIFYTNCKENINLGTNYSRKLKLYAAEFTENKWQTPHTFIFNDSSCSYGHPCMSPDGKMFFFSSDMKGGMGGVDLYVCLNIENKWTNPINLGNTINTPGDELYPFYHVASGKLYFTSNYHTGMGGFDLFEASELEGEWGQVRNLGVPFNSADDDFALYLSPGLHYGFLSSNRPGGMGKEDVFLLKHK